MDDDFNTPEAVAVLFDLANEVNRSQSAQVATQLKALAGILGLLQGSPQDFLQGGAKILLRHRTTDSMSETTQESMNQWIGQQIEARIAAKKSKNFAEADRIRKELSDAGIVLEDTPQGTTWRRA